MLMNSVATRQISSELGSALAASSFLSATCEASSHEGKNACQPKRLAHVSFPECKGTNIFSFVKSQT